MTHASVFSGIGGPEVAATMLGWQNLFHCEINPFGRQVLDYWYPEAESYEDITTTDFTKWRGRVDVLTGGFPCQPFSYAGQRRGATDDRYLWPYMFRCIDQIRPAWVVAENVAGILTMVEQGEVSQVASAPNLFDEGDAVRGQYRLRETFTLQRICDDLESHGYSVQPVLIPACGVGAPTEGTGCSSSDTEMSPILKTPCTFDANSDNMKSEGVSGTSGTLAQEMKSGYILKRMPQLSDMLPTPTAIEGVKWTNTWNPNSQMGQSLSAMAGSGMLPTPITSDSGGGAQKIGENGRTMRQSSGENFSASLKDLMVTRSESGGVTSRLSPLFTEEMMGFPFLWTALPFLSQSGAPKPSKPTATPSSPK